MTKNIIVFAYSQITLFGKNTEGKKSLRYPYNDIIICEKIISEVFTCSFRVYYIFAIEDLKREIPFE